MTEPPIIEFALWDTAFEPYAKAIGYLVREWNDFQEKLCGLFGTVLDLPDHAVSRAIWYAIQNDRLQRKIILEAATSKLSSGSPIITELTWLIRHADGLGSQRDDAVHTPVSLLLAETPEFISRTLFGHPRATTLQGKKLLAEFEFYQKKIRALLRFADALERYIEQFNPSVPAPLPRIPEMPPDLPKTPQAKQEPRKSLPKPQKPQPQS